jgi:hypothetical protein
MICPNFAEPTHSMVINIEVPVRVFKGGGFVDGLKLEDFEVLEDGVPQKVEAVYLISKDTITRKEEKKKKFRPETERTFYLFFEVSEWHPRLGKAVDGFCQDVLLPRDKLIAVTPGKTYRLKEEGFALKSREEIASELKSHIRKDSYLGSSEYRSALKDLEEIAQILNNKLAEVGDPVNRDRTQRNSGTGLAVMAGGDLDEIATRYIAYLNRLEGLRRVNELRIMDFAKLLKEQEGQKYVFLFYQREFVPMIDPKIMTAASTSIQDYLGVDVNILLADVTNHYNRDMGTDVERIKKAYADASTAVHFLFLTKPAPDIPGVYFQERSSDTLTPFFEMAKASGGFAESSANAEFLFQKAVEVSENYYLLYYSPKDYQGDGKFKTIKVRVKGKGYKVSHRLGYFSN